MKQVLTMFLTALLTLTGCRQAAEILVYNGTIYTVDEGFDTVSAMAIDRGRIVTTGDEKTLRGKYTFAREVNLQGKAAYPGFVDAHCHFYGYGLTLTQADLTGTASVDEIVQRLQDHARALPSAWITGRGWDQNDWPGKQFPDRHLLDKAFPDKPVFLTRIDGHAAWVNSKALAMAGIAADTRVNGGEILMDADGPTGILIDNAMSLMEKLVPGPSPAEKTAALLKAEQRCFAVGLTAVGDAGLDYETVMRIDSLQQAGSLQMRIYAMLNPGKENTEHFIRKGIYVTDRLTVRSVKLFADGALGSRGALLKKPYADDPRSRGVQVSYTGKLDSICRLAYTHGYQVNTHCIGDSAVTLMLNLYSGILPKHNNLRWRIEHSQVVDPADLPLYREYAIIPSIQTTHATSDMSWAEARLGADRISRAYAYKTLLATNGWLPNGSDFPVEDIPPLNGFYAAVARKDLHGLPAGGYRMEEALSRTEALRAMTIWAAKAAFGEKDYGSLEPGKWADFVVLDKDIMKVEADVIPAIPILQTWSAGKEVYNNAR